MCFTFGKLYLPNLPEPVGIDSYLELYIFQIQLNDGNIHMITSVSYCTYSLLKNYCNYLTQEINKSNQWLQVDEGSQNFVLLCINTKLV